MNSLSCLLSVTAGAAVVTSYIIVTIALTTQDIAQIRSSLAGCLEARLEQSNLDILHLFEERNILVSEEDPPPSVSQALGGSRYTFPLHLLPIRIKEYAT